MAGAKSVLQIPFDQKGNLYRQARISYKNSSNVIWKDNYVFEESIRFTKLHRYQSSCYAEFQSIKNGTRYYMFTRELEALLSKHTIKLGIVHGRFTFRKVGNTFGIKIISTDRLENIV